MDRVVIDASAVIAYLRREPGAELAKQHIPGAYISSVNLAEIVSKLVEEGMSLSDAKRTIGELGMDVIPFSEPDALDVGGLRAVTKQHGLSIGDRACLALARARRLPALTADRAWAALDLGVEVRLIRE